MKEAIKVNISWDKSSVLEGGDVVLEYAEQGLNGMRGKTGVSTAVYYLCYEEEYLSHPWGWGLFR